MKAIFKTVIDISYHRLVNLNPGAEPIVLLLVCKLWNKIALSLPALWNNLSARPRSLSDIRLMTAWLKRSRQAPLQLYFNAASNAEIADVGPNVLLHHRSHWQRVEIDWSQQNTQAPILVSSFDKRPATHLVMFSLSTAFRQGFENEDSHVATQLGKLLNSSPNLRDFHWAAQQHPYDGESLGLSGITFNQLRTLHLTCMLSFLE